MHIVLGILGAIITILILLRRLDEAGIDLGWLNIFLWSRRRKWKKQYEGNPIYAMKKPMDVTALLMVGTAKANGDMSVEQKQTILNLFTTEFHLSERDASGLLVSSAFLLKDGEELRKNVAKVIAPSQEQFTKEQAESAVLLLKKVAEVENNISSEIQNELIEQVKLAFASKLIIDESKWGK